jgi:hypothetical protein
MMTTSYLLYKLSYSPYSYVSWAKRDLAENKYEQYLFVMFKFDLSERTTEKWTVGSALERAPQLVYLA